MIETPGIGFGIYSDNNKVAYINKDIWKEFDCSSYLESFEDLDSMRKASKVYEELYEQVRRMFSTDMARDESIISMYIENLKTLSGNGLFAFYKRLYPSFFNWANNTNY